MKRSWYLVPVMLLIGVSLPAGAAAATAPERLGPFTETEQFTVDCGTFAAAVSGTSSTRFTVFFDASGDVTRAQQFVRAPGDLWENTTTGKSVVVRGEFVQTYTRVPGTDEFTVTIVGFRYLVNEPGSGVIVQEVGRIVYAEPSEETILAMAGQHDLADEARITPVFCGALA
jgi:hypothetical protein